jgi:hypothetical protein
VPLNLLKMAILANRQAMLLGAAHPQRRPRLERQARGWVSVNEPRLDRAIATLSPQQARHPHVDEALRALHRLRALSGAGTARGQAEAMADDAPLDPAVAELLGLTRRYVSGEGVPLHAIAREVRRVRDRAGTLPVRDLDLSVGAITNIDSHRRRQGLRDATFGPPLRSAAARRLRVR